MGEIQRSFTRWQAITISQLGYAINLILSLATAALGFSLSLAKDGDKFAKNCLGKHLLLLTIAMFLGSVGVGIWCVINRLRDFRKTMGIARDTELGNLTLFEKERRRAETDKLGKFTWGLFRWQIGLFGGGLLNLMAVFLLVYHASLL
jgi:hypothetical protein